MLTAAQLQHRLRFIRQAMLPPEIAIIGGYHGGNLGDMALGQTVRKILGRRRSDLQTIYSLSRWPKTSRSIVGGGAVLTKLAMSELMNRFADKPDTLSITGIDVEVSDFSKEEVAFLRLVPFISARSRSQALWLRGSLKREDVAFAPDIVFSNESIAGHETEEKIAGLNLTPRFYLEYNKCPSKRNGRRLQAFVKVAELIIEKFLDEGYKLIHFPFTPQDNEFATKHFPGLRKSIFGYSGDFIRVRQEMKKCSVFFASRYHSVIFCLVDKIPQIPFLYAEKSYRLFDDLISAGPPVVGWRDLEDGAFPASVPNSWHDVPLCLSDFELDSFRAASRWQVEQAVLCTAVSKPERSRD